MTESLRCHLRTKSSDQTETEIPFDSGLHVIYGSAGSGKSGLAHLLAGLPSPKSARWEWKVKPDGTSVQIVMQNPDMQILFPTVREELSFNLECMTRDSNRIRILRDKIYKLPFSLPDPERHPVTLSGGEKEVLNLVTALSGSPKLLVIDDGLSFLNDGLKRKVVKYLKSWLDDNDSIIFWFTSEMTDLNLSDKRWVLKSTGISPFEGIIDIRYKNVSMTPGNLDLEINGLSFGYDGREIFNDFSYSTVGARSIGVTGENGSGKTTLACLLTDILKPGKGTIKVSIDGNYDLNVGYIDQFPERVTGLKTPDEFLEILVKNSLFKNSQKEKMVELLSGFDVDWEEIRQLPASELPWTTIRLVLNFIAACGEYDLLILDEPTFGLGWEQKCMLMDFYEDYLKNKYLIIISHDYDFIEKICNVSCVVERKSIRDC